MLKSAQRGAGFFGTRSESRSRATADEHPSAVVVTRSRPLELALDLERDFSDGLPHPKSLFRVDITAPATLIAYADGLPVTEHTFRRDGVPFPVIINGTTAALWSTSSGESFAGLRNGTPYIISVYDADKKVAAVTAMPLVPSGAPTKVRICTMGETSYPCRANRAEAGSLRVVFEPPSFFGGDSISSVRYVVELAATPEFAKGLVQKIVEAEADKTLQMVAVSGLRSGTAYWARVTAMTDVGLGNTSSVSALSEQVPSESDVLPQRQARQRLDEAQDELKRHILANAGSVADAKDYLGSRNLPAADL